MDGLLDFVKTPEGQGLLAAAFGGLAGARRGAPVNTLGIAGLAGLTGYSTAQSRESTEQYRNMQAQQIQANLKKQQMAMDMAQRMFGGQPVPGSAPDGSAMANAQGSAPQGRQPQGAFPLALNDVAAYNMLDLPNGSTILDLYKQANNPQERKGGNYYVDPRTGAQTYMPKMAEGVMMNAQGQAMPVPGAAQANAGYKGAEAGAEAAAQFPWAVAQKRAEQVGAAGLDPMKVVGQDGNEYFVPRLNVASGAGGSAPGQSGGLMAGRNPVSQKATEGLNSDFISGSYRPTLDASKTAQDMNGSISAMRSIPIDTGFTAGAKAAAANVLVGLGIPLKNAELLASNAQQYQSTAMSQINKQLQDNKGTQTEGDAARALQTFASLEKTPMANAYILDLAQAKNNAVIRKADYYEKAVKIAQERGIPLSEVDAQYRKVQQSIWADPVMARWANRDKQ